MKSIIDMSRPNALYGTGVGILVAVSLILSNIPQSNLSQYLVIPHRKEIAILAFSLGILAGITAMFRQLNRTKYPWKIPQSQVFWAFGLFFVLTLAGLLVAK